MRKEFDSKERNIGENISLETLREAYHAGITRLSARTANALAIWKGKFTDEEQFFHRFFAAGKLEILRLRGVNLSALREITEFRRALENITDSAPEEEEPEINEAPVPIAEPEPEPTVVQDTPAIPEEAPLNFVEPEEDADSLFSDDAMQPVPMSAPSGISDADYERFSQMQETLGHFPLFAAIEAYIEGLEDPGKTIVKESIRVYDEVELTDIESLMDRLSLTGDAVRNRRYVMLQKLESFFHLLHDAGYISKNPYNFQMNHVEREINASEGTNFRLQFVYWALGTAFPELTLLGDTTKFFTAINNSRQALFLAPTALFDIFDFQGFIGTINDQLKVRRINEESISLSGLMSEHFKVRYYEEELPEVERTCRTFLYINFPVEVDYGNVIFPSNKKKTNTQIVEKILRAAHRPMKLSEILDEFLYECPERDVNEDRIRGAIYSSDKIIATMPPGSFAWDDGTHQEFKGGSVITHVNAYLQSLPEKIATSAAVTEYVMSFIPDTNEEKVINRLFSDQAKDIVTYYREGVRYIGYIDGDYPDDFFTYPSDYRIALTYSTMFPAFIQFVQEHHRYPFTRSEDKEEMKIRLFWIRVEHMYETGELDARTAKYFERISGPLSSYKMDKPEYFWRVQYAHLAKEIGMELEEAEAFFLNYGPFESTADWTKRNLTDYKYRIDKMQDWKKERIERIIGYLQSYDNPYSELINKLKLNV